MCIHTCKLLVYYLARNILFSYICAAFICCTRAYERCVSVRDAQHARPVLCYDAINFMRIYAMGASHSI